MGSIVITVQDISDNDLVYNEAETRQILKFFWPEQAAQIDEFTMDNNARRLAQTALIAAIEGSYAMGFIHMLATSIVRPGSASSRSQRNWRRSLSNTGGNMQRSATLKM